MFIIMNNKKRRYNDDSSNLNEYQILVPKSRVVPKKQNTNDLYNLVQTQQMTMQNLIERLKQLENKVNNKIECPSYII
jgi:hypothetical protein